MKFIIDMKLDNWNNIIGRCRSNKIGANTHKQKEMKYLSYYMMGLPKIKNYPIEMTFTWHIKSLLSDLDNKSIKSILDEMQILGILENDNIKCINKITHIAVNDKKEYVEIEIKENNINGLEK